MKCIVGLGNPGSKYAATRHNIGFMIVDALATRMRLTFSDASVEPTRWSKLAARFGRKRRALVGKGTHSGRPCVLLKPLTYMNRSGEEVTHYVRVFQLDVPDLLVIFDDISLPIGTIRLRKKGGAGGHNGLQDIIDHLHTSDFPRLRFGIGNDFARGQQIDYVLSPFAAAEQPGVEDAIRQATEAALTCVREGIDIAMNRYNRRP